MTSPECPASRPRFERRVRGGVAWWTDPAALDRGVLIAITERVGGVSVDPFGSLNLAAHVEDDPAAVDENRSLLLGALGLGALRQRLTMAEQVHGDSIEVVQASRAGAGAYAGHGMRPIAATDALVTAETDLPLGLCFADCVPVVLVAPGGEIAVAHAGWRGALVGIAGSTAESLANVAGCRPSELVAYIGPHIGACHYTVSDELLSQFCNTFGTVARANSGGLDLDASVTASLVDAGVTSCSIARLGTCTAEATDRFFSHRAEHGRTGRHMALACRLSGAFSASA